MAEIVSLSQARKARDRLKKRAQADANSVKFGRTKTKRAAEDLAAAKTRHELDGKRKDPE